MSYGIIEKYKKENINKLKDIVFCPMIDARRMEVYYALYNSMNNELKTTSAEVITADSFNIQLEKYRVVFFGDGAAKCKTLINHKNATFIDNINPSSLNMIKIANQKYLTKEFENLAYFEPFYLKEFIAKKPSVKGLYNEQ
jgi:tRNA threonylcarbamoyladenosine biosynthesis protein TsaB